MGTVCEEYTKPDDRADTIVLAALHRQLLGLGDYVRILRAHDPLR